MTPTHGPTDAERLRQLAALLLVDGHYRACHEAQKGRAPSARCGRVCLLLRDAIPSATLEADRRRAVIEDIIGRLVRARNRALVMQSEKLSSLRMIPGLLTGMRAGYDAVITELRDGGYDTPPVPSPDVDGGVDG